MTAIIAVLLIESFSVIQTLINQIHKLTCDTETFLIQILVSQTCKLTCNIEFFLNKQKMFM